MNEINPLDIAIVGMSCYFPEAYSIDEYWHNLSKGICSVKQYTDEELLNRGVKKSDLRSANYIKASPYFSRTRYFDASFFKVNPGEANIMDPQRRLFIENCWQALEDAGYVPEKYSGKIGVFGSTGINLYLIGLISDRNLIKTIGEIPLISSNDKDGLPTQSSYLLNLTGPSVNVNTACSSTLVGAHLARQSLLMGDSDMVIVGGAALIIPENIGYFHEPDGILSSDGFCRAFDDSSSGTLWGSGSGAVVMKRLSDAIADGDNIRAIIKGSALNNDGSNKVGYTAPSIEGQTEVLLEAYASSQISPETISYIEAHGTGTKIGDPIEVAALTKSFREYTDKKRYCGLGSVKTNFGHLGAVAGLASLIKAVLVLENRQIPPNLHFQKPNSNIDFDNSPFYVNTELKTIESDAPFRVGVTSLGVGGTNAHIILEEAGKEYQRADFKSDEKSVIILSARNNNQLDKMKKNMLNYLEKNSNVSLCDIAFTLQTGRRDFKNKSAFYAHSIEQAIDILKHDNHQKYITDTNYSKNIDINENQSSQMLYNWFQGEQVDWNSLYKNEKPRRKSLPTYPFSDDVYWIEANKNEEMIDIKEEEVSRGRIGGVEDWFYYRSWNQTALPPVIQQDEHAAVSWLVFVDNQNLGFDVGSILKSRGDRVVFVYPGKKYLKKSDDSYIINIENPSDYQNLIKSLVEKDLLPDSILHFIGLNESVKGGVITRIKALFSFQKYGLSFFLHFIKTINKEKITKKLNIISILNNTFDISGNEIVFSEKNTVLSALKVIQQEYPFFKNRVIDIDLNFLKQKNRTDLLVNEIVSNNTDIVCSYRKNKRWILNYHQLKIQEKDNQKTVFKKNGVYFAFGGLTGGIPAIYEYIIKKYQAKLIFIDDNYLPAEKDWKQWNDAHGTNEYNNLRIKTIKHLRTLGAEYIDNIDILTMKGKNKLEKRIREIEKKYGNINGLIHGAGGYAASRIAPLSESEENLNMLSLYNLSSIPATLLVINEIFKKKNLDFKFLFTSLSNVFAGPSFFSYCAADSVAISLALEANKKLTRPWSVICWDSLEPEWFEDLVEENMAILYNFINTQINEALMTIDEGNRCLELAGISGGQFNPIIVCCTNFQSRYNLWVKMERDSESSLKNKTLKPRPQVSTNYEPPETELEQKIAETMSEILGITGIGKNDSFFDLGGNSLVGIQFASKIREIASVDFDLSKVFEMQNVAEIAKYLESIT